MNCLICQQLLPQTLTLREFLTTKEKSVVCEDCKIAFEKLKGNLCQCCARPSFVSICEDCAEWKKKIPDYTLSHHALFRYDKAMKEYFAQYKFLGERRLSEVFAYEIRKALKNYRKFVIIPIPVSQTTFQERGFNQVEEFLKSSGIPYVNALKKEIGGKKQGEKNKKERMETENPFTIHQDAIQQIRQQPLCIFDDIYTTGRTILHAVETLRPYTNQKIITFSLAR